MSVTPYAPYINISKLDAAKRQLETAVRLFFSNSDPVSIHTLSAAAQEVLSKLIKSQNLGQSFFEEMKNSIKEEKQKEVMAKFKESQNFFKHADKDPDEMHKFHFKITEFFLWDTCKMYQVITREVPPLMKVFDMWFNAEYSDILFNKETRKLLVDIQAELSLNPKNRVEFFNKVLSYIMKSGLINPTETS